MVARQRRTQRRRRVGTVSDELADGVERLLGDLGSSPAWRSGRRRSRRGHALAADRGADQVERAVPRPRARRPRRAASSRASASGSRRPAFAASTTGTPWLRVADTPRAVLGSVYSLEVPAAHTVVTSGGDVHNCFPKDVTALKQLAGNSGYHFQLLTAVIEVNELQKRRVISSCRSTSARSWAARSRCLGSPSSPTPTTCARRPRSCSPARLQADGRARARLRPGRRGGGAQAHARRRVLRSALDALDGADAVVLVTEWPEFAELDRPRWPHGCAAAADRRPQPARPREGRARPA